MHFSKITDDLFIGNTPSLNRLRPSARPRRAAHHQHALLASAPTSRSRTQVTHQHLWLRSIDSPFFPLSIPKLIHGARAALETIRDGGKVYAHCAYGRHRGVAMGACILIAQGYDPQEAMQLIAERRSVADPFAWYIQPRILKFAKEWK